MKKWYAIQIMSGHEKKVKKALEEGKDIGEVSGLIEQIVVPTAQVAEMKKGEQKISEKRLWPGYALVKMELTDDSWMYIKNTNGVIGFIGGGKPPPLDDDEVQSILNELTERKDEVVSKHLFQVGDEVKIVDGVFVNFTGSILEVFDAKGRLSVMVSIFGRDTRVDDLEFWQVEQVPADMGTE